jgi:hypothetical protein
LDLESSSGMAWAPNQWSLEAGRCLFHTFDTRIP